MVISCCLLVPFGSIFISKIKLIIYYNWFKLHHQYDKMGSIPLRHLSYLSTPLWATWYSFDYDVALYLITIIVWLDTLWILNFKIGNSWLLQATPTPKTLISMLTSVVGETLFVWSIHGSFMALSMYKHSCKEDRICMFNGLVHQPAFDIWIS